MENNLIPHNAAKALAELHPFMINFYIMRIEFQKYVDRYPEIFRDNSFQIKIETEADLTSCAVQAIEMYELIGKYCAQNKKKIKPTKEHYLNKIAKRK